MRSPTKKMGEQRFLDLHRAFGSVVIPSVRDVVGERPAYKLPSWFAMQLLMGQTAPTIGFYPNSQ